MNDSATVQLEHHGERATTAVLATEEVRGDVHPTVLSGSWPSGPDQISLGKATISVEGLRKGEKIESRLRSGSQ